MLALLSSVMPHRLSIKAAAFYFLGYVDEMLRKLMPHDLHRNLQVACQSFASLRCY